METAYPLGFFIQGWEWLVLLIVALLVFGKRLPDVARSLGKAVTEFKRGVRDIQEDVDVEEDSPRPERLKPIPPAKELKEPATPSAKEPEALESTGQAEADKKAPVQ